MHYARPAAGLPTLLVIFFAVPLLAGCNKNDSSSVPPDSKVFESAAPEIRAKWDTAVAADRTNNYVVAYTQLLQLRHPQTLSAAQLQAANSLFNRLVNRLTEALQKGDPAARKAAEEISHIDKSGH